MKTKSNSHYKNPNDLLAEWVNQYTHDLLRWATFKTNNKEVAEDLIQETFLAALKGLDGFKNESNPKTWLTAILNNKILDYHRYRLKNIVISSTKNDNTESEALFNNLFDNYDNWQRPKRPMPWSTEPENLLDNTEFQITLKNCMSELPEIWLSAVQLKYTDEKNAKEICQELNISTTNYWQLIHRAKLKIRTCLDANWFRK